MTKSRDTADSINRIDSSAADATAITIDANENVGIGTTSPAGLLHLSVASGVGSPDLILERTDTSVASGNQIGSLQFFAGEDGSEEKVAAVRAVAEENFTSSSSETNLRFETTISGATSASERMRITGDGSVLVAQTSGSSADAGHILAPTGGAFHVRDGGISLILDRLTSDGEIARFRKDGTTVGSILNNSTNLKVNGVGALELSENGTTRVYVDSGGFFPFADNTYDIGSSGLRFNDAYITNGVTTGSDQNEKQQIATLTDAEIAAAKRISNGFKTFKWNDAVAAKGDNARTHTGVIAQEVRTALEAEGLNAGNYAFFMSDTWWETQTDVPAVEAVEAQDAVYDDDGNLVSEAVEAVEARDAYTRTDIYDTAEEAPEGATERTRLGIRYPELLAFVGAATEQRLTHLETLEARIAALENV